MLTGQTTLVPLTGFTLGWWALERGRPFAAGLAFSVIALKPNFGLALGFVLILSGSWRIVAGTIAGLAGLVAATIAIAGPDASAVEPENGDRCPGGSIQHRAVGSASHTGASRDAGIRCAASGGRRRLDCGEHCGDRTGPSRLGTHGPLDDADRGAARGDPRGQPSFVVCTTRDPLAPACIWLVDRGMAEHRWDLVVGAILLPVIYVVPQARAFGVPMSLVVGLILLWQLGRKGTNSQ